MLHILLLTIVQFQISRNLTFHEEFSEHAQVAVFCLIDLDELKAYCVRLFLQTALN